MSERVKKSQAIFDVRPPGWGRLVAIKEEVQPGSRSRLDELISEILEEETDPHEELVAVLDRVIDPTVELTGVGAQFIEKKNFKNTRRNQLKIKNNHAKEKDKVDDFYNKIIEKIREPVTARVAYAPHVIPEYSTQKAIKRERVILPDIREEVVSFYKKSEKLSGNFKPKPFNIVQGKLLNFSSKKPKNGLSKYKWFMIVVGLGLVVYSFTLKNELMQDGFSALDNLEQAQDSFKNFNFIEAAGSFRKSYDDFVQASQNLNLAGAGLAGLLTDLPGFDKLTVGGAGKIKSAKDLVEAGKLMASAGEAMSVAMSAISQTGSILDPNDNNKTKPSRIIRQLKDALALSGKNFGKAEILLVNIDESVIPEDKRETLHDFRDKIPILKELLVESQGYVVFLEGIIGINESKKYLLLFNNYSELRPTGGFPGTYGVVSFFNGGLENFFVDDVYNLDGQLKRNIIPPKQLQHITPTWGMRDATWFIDFPASARKAMWFFSQEAGYGVDGVITFNPDIVSNILKIVGPIEMPEYDMALTADNFLASIQEEVEYGPNRVQPKQVVVDFAPRFLEKLYSADSEKWMAIFNVLMVGVEENDILFYFNDKDSERFILENGFGGEVKNTIGDYLTINFSNIKGSKTDAVTNSSVEVDNRFEDRQIIHKVTIKRNHSGGDHEHGFYNRQNSAYVRVLVPEKAEILNISGNDLPNFRPLISYSLQSNFEKDRDLVVFESSFYSDNSPAGWAGFQGVDKFEESGKKGLGFWMITEPGESKEVQLEYSVPLLGSDYNFYFQKQSGLDWKNFNFKLNSSDDYSIIETLPSLNKIGDLYVFDEVLKKDFELKAKFSALDRNN